LHVVFKPNRENIFASSILGKRREYLGISTILSLLNLMDSLLDFFPESKVNSRINNLRNKKSLAHSKKKKLTIA